MPSFGTANTKEFDLSILKIFEDDFINAIPSNLVICSINFDIERGDVYITRLEKNNPTVFKLPLTRTSTRQGETDGLTFQMVSDNFADIMKRNQESTRGAKYCTTSQARRTWFDTRKFLDGELKEFLEQIEDKWLGGFKVVNM